MIKKKVKRKCSKTQMDAKNRRKHNNNKRQMDAISENESSNESTVEDPDDCQIYRLGKPIKDGLIQNGIRGWCIETFWQSSLYTIEEQNKPYTAVLKDAYTDGPTIFEAYIANPPLGTPKPFLKAARTIIRNVYAMQRNDQ